MTTSILGVALIGIVLAMAGPARADDDPLDAIKMEVVEHPDADERDYVEEISLPEAASSTGRERSAKGIERANEAREDGRAFGQSTASEARSLGRDANRGRGPDGEFPDTGPPEDKPGKGGPPDDIPGQQQ